MTGFIWIWYWFVKYEFLSPGKQLIQTCLSSPDPFEAGTSNNHNNEQRMSAQGFEDSDLNFEPPVDSKVNLGFGHNS